MSKEQKRVIQTGESCYIRSADIYVWNNYPSKELKDGEYVPCNICAPDIFSKNCLPKYANTLFEVVYLGNGVLQEKLTGEKIQLWGGTNCQRPEFADGKTLPIIIPNFKYCQKAFLDFNDYDILTPTYSENVDDKIYSYLFDINTFKENIKKYPLTYHMFATPMKIEEHQELYKSESDDVRIELLKEIKAQSLANIKVIYEKLKETIEKTAEMVSNQEFKKQILDSVKLELKPDNN